MATHFCLLSSWFGAVACEGKVKGWALAAFRELLDSRCNSRIPWIHRENKTVVFVSYPDFATFL